MDETRLRKLVADGESLRGIGILLGASPFVIRNRLKRLGIKTRIAVNRENTDTEAKSLELICRHHGLTTHWRWNSAKGPRFKCGKCNVAAVSKRRRKLKLLAVEHKGGKCEKCGYNRCIAALEFHHPDPGEKDFQLSQSHVLGWVEIRAEIDKCLLLCANCHRETHAELIGE